MSSGQAVSNLIVVVIVFFFAAFFVAAEFSIVSVRKSQIESMLEDGEGNKKKLEMALKMVDNMNEYLSTTQVGVSLTGIILGWLGADTLSQIFADFFGFTPLNHTTIMAFSAVLGVVLLTYLEVVLTEIPNDGERNLIGKVKDEDLGLLDFIKPGQHFKFIK